MTSDMDDHEITLTLHWRHSWPDKDADYVAEAAGHDGTVGRIYESIVPGGTGTHWFWAMNAHGAFVSRAGKTSGSEATPRRAAREVEKAWAEAIRGTALEAAAAKPARNAYAAAKGRD